VIPVGFGYGDGDEFFMRGWVWDSETRPRPAPLPSLHIMQHMLKCKASDTPLPYGILITQIMQYCGMDVSADARTTIGKRHHFSTSSLKRLNIINVDGVWQHDRAVNDDEVQGQPQNPLHGEDGMQPDHSIGNHEEPPFQLQSHMLNRVWDGVQDL